MVNAEASVEAQVMVRIEECGNDRPQVVFHMMARQVYKHDALVNPSLGRVVWMTVRKFDSERRRVFGTTVGRFWLPSYFAKGPVGRLPFFGDFDLCLAR
jgi:hypothetical protein